MSKDLPMTFVDAVQHLSDNFHDSASSLPEFVGSTRNDFLTLVEADIADMAEIKDVLGVANTLVASYYLAAFTLHIGIPGVDVRGELDKFAVERSPIKTAIKFALGIGLTYLAGKSIFGREHYVGTLGAAGDFGKILATESFKQMTPDEQMAEIIKREDKLKSREERLKSDFDKMKQNQERESIRRERERLEKDRERLKEEQDALESEPGALGVSYGKQDVAKHLAEGGDLSTGKTFDMTIERDGNRMPLSLNISLSVMVADKVAMKTILGVGDYEYSFENRKMLASAGARSWIRDIALSRDLIDQMRKNRRADKTGFYKSVVAARNKNWLSSLFGNVSVNNASSVIIVSSDTVDEMEPVLGGPLSDFNIRQRLFKDTLTMLIFVVDQRWENITIYHRGLSRATELDFRAIKNSKGGNKMDVDEIIRAYQAGSAPLGR